MFSTRTHGSFSNLERYLQRQKTMRVEGALRSIAEQGVAALMAATPRGETSEAATSWDYILEVGPDSSRIVWTNDDIEDGFPVVIGIQYGHATGSGGYVEGIDFINPALRPIFDRFSYEMGRVVKSA